MTTRTHECSRCCNDTLVTAEELELRLCTECQTHCELCEGELLGGEELRRGVCNRCAGNDPDMFDQEDV